MDKRLYYGDLLSLSTDGGYSVITRLSEMTAAFLLSACVPLRDREMWESPISPITDTEYTNILAMIENAEYELMSSFAIGQIISTVTDISSNPNVLPMDGSTIDGNDYPELLSSVPMSWVSGTDITLPNMSEKGVFGENGDIGDIIGENSVILSVGELPSHTHTQNPHTHSEIIPAITPTAGGEIPATASLVVASATVTGSTTATNNNTGNDEAHNNIQASLSVFWWIVAR